MLDPNDIPSGLSWGIRGCRIGKSVYGNWWVSVALPFGFRYTWRIGNKWNTVITTTVPKNPPKIQNQGLGQKPPLQQARTPNQQVLDKIKQKP